MATSSKTSSGAVEKHGIRAIKTASGVSRIASLWLKTASGFVKIYEAIRSCYGSGRWRYGKPYRYGDRWRYGK